MATLTVPDATAMKKRPLSTHGMPKDPQATSPDRPHRFSALGYPPQSTIVSSISLRSPGPLSPPMSARSFGTFIDSEPSTPAYSPRMDDNWDSSTLVLLRPTSSASEPASPTEPVWQMMSPVKRSRKKPSILESGTQQTSISTKTTSMGMRLAAPPVKKVKSSQSAKQPKKCQLEVSSEKENTSPYREGCKAEVSREQTTENSAVPFGKLASKMKYMLRRKSTNEKNSKKDKDYYQVGEDVHWTEM